VGFQRWFYDQKSVDEVRDRAAQARPNRRPFPTQFEGDPEVPADVVRWHLGNIPSKFRHFVAARDELTQEDIVLFTKEDDRWGDPAILKMKMDPSKWAPEEIGHPVNIQGFTEASMKKRVDGPPRPSAGDQLSPRDEEPKIAHLCGWRQILAGPFQKPFFEWPLRRTWTSELRGVHQDWAFPLSKAEWEHRQWVGAWLMDSIWTEVCSRVDPRRREVLKFIAVPNPTYKALHVLTLDTLQQDGGMASSGCKTSRTRWPSETSTKAWRRTTPCTAFGMDFVL
jgi:hypothetical protein